MTQHNPPVGIPCAVCLTTVDTWTADDVAVPCGHTLEQIGDLIREALTRKVRFGEFAPVSA